MNPYQSPQADQQSEPRAGKPNALRDWSIGIGIVVIMAAIQLILMIFGRNS